MTDYRKLVLRSATLLGLLSLSVGCRLQLEPAPIPTEVSDWVEPSPSTPNEPTAPTAPSEPAPVTSPWERTYTDAEWAELKRLSDTYPNDVLREGHVGYVLHVVDGDTLDVQVRNRYLKTRFQGASAPECEKDSIQVGRTSRLQCVSDDEFYGLKSAQTLIDIVEGHEVIVHCEGVGAGNPCATDQYNRSLSNLRLDDGRDVGATLIRAGAAWASTAFESNTRAEYCAAEYTAREARVGMWANGDVEDVIRRMSAGTQRWYRQHDARCDEALKDVSIPR